MKYNTKFDLLFPNDADKAKAFTKVAEMFFDQNFSSASKSEIELLLFSLYMEATIEHSKLPDGTVDYGTISDYEMGKELGIPQEKVRSLKIKKQARYPVEFDWKEALLSIKSNVRYEKEKIIIPVRDPSLYNEIRNFIEDHGGYIEVQRSGNVIQIRPEYYFMLIYEDLNETDKEKCRKSLIKELHRQNIKNEIKEGTDYKDVLKCASTIAKYGIKGLCSIQGIPESPLFKILQAIVIG